MVQQSTMRYNQVPCCKYVYVCCVIYSRFKCVHINASMYVVLFIAVLNVSI